jgi:50S ribosomal protein L16 3-hydroxylase
MSEVLRRLGTLSVARFMRETWQRRPLLIRGAIEGFTPPVDRARLFELALQPDAEARLIRHTGGEWRLQTSPLNRLPSPRRAGWTILVQGVDLMDDGAHALLQRFRFVPDARLDDLMVSYATDGGGVGPHVDNYDVFLLQAHGRRRWRISRQRDLSTVDGAPLQLLANFRSTGEFVLEPGDMLYLPPGVAHEGTALGECLTYSIGFRAPTHQELFEPFLSDVSARTRLPGRYGDRGQSATRHPGALPATMIEKLYGALSAPRPTPQDASLFLLAYLSEPKAQVVFDRPVQPLRASGFADRARRSGVVLDRRTRLLYRGRTVGINGEVLRVDRNVSAVIRRLSDRRALLPSTALSKAVLEQLYPWYCAGWLHTPQAQKPSDEAH